MKMEIESHFDGEAWGIAMVQDEGTNMFITCGDDNTLLLYDVPQKRVVGRGKVDKTASQPTKRAVPVRGGASSQSRYPASQQGRGIDYDCKLNHLAVGNNEGVVSIRQINDL